MSTTADHYLARDWPPDTPTVHPTTAEYALGEHACNLARERDAALETAAREHAENQRLAEANRQLRERVALQGQTIAALRRQLAVASTGRVMKRIDAALSGPCACLGDGAGGEPRRGRWIPWVRAR